MWLWKNILPTVWNFGSRLYLKHLFFQHQHDFHFGIYFCQFCRMYYLQVWTIRACFLQGQVKAVCITQEQWQTHVIISAFILKLTSEVKFYFVIVSSFTLRRLPERLVSFYFVRRKGLHSEGCEEEEKM